jgi:hypothetical protein
MLELGQHNLGLNNEKARGINKKKIPKFALHSQLLAVQILTKDVQMLILCLSYFINTVYQVLIKSGQWYPIIWVQIYFTLRAFKYIRNE